MPHIHIVLHEPEIASNTGNIGRTCAATGSWLHLIEPLGFHLSEKAIRRSGMDYWDKLTVKRYLDYEDFLGQHPEATVFYATTKGAVPYTEAHFSDGCYLMFGKESGGIPEEILRSHPGQCIRIPMGEEIRSLNLANSVAIILYEALRQLGFPDLSPQGEHALAHGEQ